MVKVNQPNAFTDTSGGGAFSPAHPTGYDPSRNAPGGAAGHEAPKAKERGSFKAFDDAYDSPQEQIDDQLSFESLTGQPTKEEREEGKPGAYVEKQRARSEALNEKRKAKIDFLTERNEDGTFKYSLSDMDEQAMPDNRLMHPDKERLVDRGEGGKGDEAINKRIAGSAAAMSTLEAANSAPVGPVAKPKTETKKEGSLL